MKPDLLDDAVKNIPALKHGKRIKPTPPPVVDVPGKRTIRDRIESALFVLGAILFWSLLFSLDK